MTRETILNLGLAKELKNLAKNYPNDAEFGNHARRLINDTKEKLEKLKKEDETNR